MGNSILKATVLIDETFKKWLGHEDSALMNGLMWLLWKWVSYLGSGFLIKGRIWLPPPPAFSCAHAHVLYFFTLLLLWDDTARRPLLVVGPLTLDFPVSRTIRNKSLFFVSCSVSDICYRSTKHFRTVLHVKE